MRSLDDIEEDINQLKLKNWTSMERQVWKCEGDLTPELTMMIMKVMLG